MNPSDIARVLRAAAAEAERIAAEHRADRREWIDQNNSQLGRRRHCTIVRRRVTEGDAAATVVGRRHLLTPAAHTEELAKLGSRLRLVKTEGTAERLRRRLGLTEKGGSTR